MKKVLGAVAALLLTATPEASADEPRTRTCLRVPFVSFVLDEQVITLDVSPEQIKESPAWDPSSGKEPPVSIADAVRISSAELVRTVPNREAWRLSRINVYALCDQRAVYEVWWQEQGKRGHQNNLNVPVLMSGVALSTSSAVTAAKRREP
jgi:hypothetical protein